MRRFTQNYLGGASQDWARFHQDSIRKLEADASQTDTVIENFSREYHGSLDGISSDVLFLGDRKTYKSSALPLSLVTPPSTTVDGSVSYDLKIPSASRSGLFTFRYSVTMYDSGGGLILGEPWMWMDILVDGVIVSRIAHGENGFGTGRTGGFGYAPIDGNMASNIVQAKFYTYNFTGSTITHDISATIIVQVK